MHPYPITALAFAVAWTAAWFAFIRPALRRYARTTALMARIDAAEGSAWARLGLWLEGKKTLAVSFLLSGLTAARSAADQAAAAAVHAAAAAAGIPPEQLAPLQDKSLWSAFFTDARTMQIVAAVNILVVFLHLRGTNEAAAIVPAAQPGA